MQRPLHPSHGFAAHARERRFRLALHQRPDRRRKILLEGIAVAGFCRIFTALAESNVIIDVIVQNVSVSGATDISFTMSWMPSTWDRNLFNMPSFMASPYLPNSYDWR